jgi:hypothetical protein
MKMRWMGAAALLMMLVSCGGSGASSTTSNMEAERSGGDFNALLADPNIVPCMSGQQQECSCPGGGTLTVAADGSFALDSCKASSGQIYIGTMTPEADGTTLDLNFSVFGECMNVTGSMATDQCSGNIVGSCTSTTANCVYVTDGSTENCMLDC